MSKVGASKGIIYDLLATDQDALNKVTETIQSMVKEYERSTGKLTEMVDQTRRTKSRIADASAHLEQRLHLGAQLLHDLQEQTARLEAAEADVDACKHQSEQATARLGERLAELSAKQQQLEEARAEAEAEIRAKSELLASKESLEAELAELTTKCRQLEEARAEAEAEIRAKGELLASKESPEAELAELTAKCQQLEEAQDAAETKIGAKSRALEAISRDLHEPLGGMISLIEHLQDTKLDAQQRRQLRVAWLSLTAMQNLLESALVPQELLQIRTPADNLRTEGRLPQELLRSNLGPVLDLSLGGMRVRCARAPKGELDVDLMGLQEPFRLRAEVMWTQRQGLRKYEVGLKFVDISPEVARQLTEVSLNHSLRRVLDIW